ncbi:hypothetical protein NQ315_006411 [Exocentrus adspersus]|uniref:WW domain-containing protein n=1 Tax=Exocentrus adspersus TaxID=1586481 RepID=A0AAV8W160_9CUCU|nr:hypothetical protein NQ315_006411 [Exocentrus adspersus]
MASLQTLPPGWECKRDEHSGRHYYINHYTKSTTWEDPRLRHRPFHGTPKAVPNQESIPLQDMKPRMSPLTVRSSKVQDSSLTTVSDTDEAASKIALMFPTVSDTHIKLLLKKYHNREALVIGALKVEKNPITTPGPFATPPPQRNLNQHAPLHMTPPLGLTANSRGGSPIIRPGSGTNSTYTGSPRIGDGFRSSPRPHSSPKLKLRYMKSIFPQADETLILEVLQNQENNIQKATDALKEMGYSKKDTVKVAQQKMEAKKEEKRKEEEVKEAKAPSPQMRIKSLEEKENMKKELQAKYKDVAEHLISIALESVNFDENRANQILQIMIQEDTQAADKKKEEEPSVEPDSAVLPAPVVATIPVSQSRQSLKSLLKEKSDKEKSTFTRVIEEQNSHTQSKNLLSTKGHDPSNAKGANEKLLLEDYVKWHGPNLSLRKGPQGLAKGPNAALLSGRSCKACGPNLELRKGPKMGLAKGSIFSQLKTAVVGEARGK